MVSVVRLIGYIMLGVLCVTGTAIGIASVRKYNQDSDRFGVIQAFNRNASCNLTSTIYVFQQDDCLIEGFQVELWINSHSGEGHWIPGFTGFSNFFPTACGGLLFRQNVSRFGDNQTVVPCWYRSVNDSMVRLVPTAAFLPDKQYWFIGTALIFAGVCPPAIMLLSIGVAIVRRLSLVFHRRQQASVQRANGETGQAERQGTALEEAPPIPEIAEVRPVGADWAGRLICANDFATAAAMRLQESLRLARLEECPLCFRRFDDAVVWWTCGHYVCDECNPKVLDAERRWGHTNNPRCPLCRERSDLNDMVKIILANVDELPSSVGLRADGQGAPDSMYADTGHIHVWVE